MLEQMVRAARLDRTFYTRLIFDSYATGNAVLVVGLVYLVLGLIPWLLRGLLGAGALMSVLRVVLFGAIWWIIMSLVVWLVGAYLLEGDARLQTVIRSTGFAHTPLLAAVVPVAGFWVGLVWFGAGVTMAAETTLGLERSKAIIAAVAGVLVWLLLFGRAFA